MGIWMIAAFQLIQINLMGNIVNSYSFNGRDIKYATMFYCDQFDNGYFMDGDHDMIYRPLVAGYQYYGNIENRGIANIGSPSKLDTSHIYPSSSSNDDDTTYIPSILGYHHRAVTPLLSYLISTHTTFTDGVGGTRGDNDDFGISKKSDAISENQDLILQ